MLTFLVQIILAIFLFLLINWIGKHSYSIGYVSISTFAKIDEAPAFNYLIRVLTPVIYLIITATILYSLNQDQFVRNFYLVSVYYIGIRLIFNLATERGILLNWRKQFFYWVSIVLLSYLVYDKIISVKSNILPDFTTLANELWIIILIFLYQIFNKLKLSNDGTMKRKDMYLEKMVLSFQKKFGHIINEKIENDQIKAMVYSILLIENFNRPKIIRWIEYLTFYFSKKPYTLGIMQFKSNTYINDNESVILGVNKIQNGFQHAKKEYYSGLKEQYYSEYDLKKELISLYNSGDQYQEDISEMMDLILKKFYPETTHMLLSPNDETQLVSDLI